MLDTILRNSFMFSCGIAPWFFAAVILKANCLNLHRINTYLVQNQILVALLAIKGFFSKIYLNIKHTMLIVSFGLKRPFMPSRKWRHLRSMMYNHNMAQSAKSVKVSVD